MASGVAAASTSLGQLRRALALPAALVVVMVSIIAITLAANAQPNPGGVPTPGHRSTPPATPTAPSTPTTPARPTPPRVAVGAATVGTCFTEKTAAGSQFQYLWPQDCAATHDAEVYFNAPMAAGAFPADDAWAGDFTQLCVPAFADYVGVGWDVSKLDTHYIHPSAKAWANGDRMLTCYVVDPAGSLTSSVKASRL